MASRLYEVLNDVENGRKNCISNARLAGYDVSDNATIEEIANLFTQEPTGEAQPNVWQRPSEWIDWDTLIDWDTPDEDNLYPLVGLLMYDNSPEMKISSNTIGSQTIRDMVCVAANSKIVTSDGSTYISSATTQTHTWDVSKDINTNLGYKLRYIIIYGSTTTNLNLYTNWNKNLLEAYIGDKISTSSGISLSANNASTLSVPIQSIIVKKTGWSSPPSFNGILSLRRYETYSNISYIQDCVNLEEIIAHNATQFSATALNELPFLRKISIPKLSETTPIQGSNRFVTNLGNSKTVFVPNTIKNVILRPLYGANNTTYSGIRYLEDEQILNGALNYFPGNISAKRLVLKDATSVTSVATPILVEELVTPKLENSVVGLFNSPILENYEFPSTFKSFNNGNSLLMYSKNFKIYNDWKIPMALTNSVYLSRTCLLDILDKLADVTGESATYTLTLGSDHLAKLTSAEIAVGTAKGWVIN